MKSWMCVVSSKNWAIMKQEKLFGVNRREHRKLAQVQIGDLLAVYVKNPIDGVVAVCKVASEMFMGKSDVWGGSYPCQIEFEFLPEFEIREDDAVPLSTFLGRSNQREGFTVGPLLINRSLIELSHDDFLKLKEIFMT